MLKGKTRDRDRAEELVNVLHGHIEEMRVEGEAVAAAARSKVSALEAGRACNAAAIQVAMLDDD